MYGFLIYQVHLRDQKAISHSGGQRQAVATMQYEEDYPKIRDVMLFGEISDTLLSSRDTTALACKSRSRTRT